MATELIGASTGGRGRYHDLICKEFWKSEKVRPLHFEGGGQMTMDDYSATGLNLNEVLRRDDFDDKVRRDI